MYKCKTCGRETAALVNSREQKRCEFCYSLLTPEMEIKPTPPAPMSAKPQEPVKPAKRGKT